MQAHDLAANNDTILLVVIPAASCRDVSASRALKLAQDLDSDGERVYIYIYIYSDLLLFLYRKWALQAFWFNLIGLNLGVVLIRHIDEFAQGLGLLV